MLGRHSSSFGGAVAEPLADYTAFSTEGLACRVPATEAGDGRLTTRRNGATMRSLGQGRIQMSSKFKRPNQFPGPKAPPQVKTVDSLLDNMKDGNELGSIVSLNPTPGRDLIDELVRGIREIEAVRGRPCITYLGNVVNGDGTSVIDQSDDLPFHEMVTSVPADQRAVDVLLSTNGGSAHQVSRFVNALRARFDEVDFLIPSFCMSAGTILVLSGDRIWMTERACLGPIDPQVPSKDGRLIPAQSLMLLVKELERTGREALQKGAPVPWTAVRIVDGLDKKELADAYSASRYSGTMAAEFLKTYKFKSWATHTSTTAAVTAQEKEETATKIAEALLAHSRWKSHGHAIPRDLLSREVRLRIDHTETIPGLERAIQRSWALCNWIFTKTPVTKLLVSTHYRYVRHRIVGQTP